MTDREKVGVATYSGKRNQGIRRPSKQPNADQTDHYFGDGHFYVRLINPWKLTRNRFTLRLKSTINFFRTIFLNMTIEIGDILYLLVVDEL